MFLIYTNIVLLILLILLLTVNIKNKKELTRLHKANMEKARTGNFNKNLQAIKTRCKLGDIIENNSLQLITSDVVLVSGSEIFGDKIFSIKNLEYGVTKGVDLTTVEDKYTLEELKEYDWIIKELYEEAQKLNEEISKVFNNKYVKRKDGLNG